ncbi:MAG: hypothetical protein VKI63_01180 [Cyanobium sp.]|nr:hypothetical protein [Cyanobium sp.]
MSDHALGRALRAAIELQRRELGGQLDPRRLESGLADLVTPEQQCLLPALSYLLRAPQMARLLSQPTGLHEVRSETTVVSLRHDLRNLYTTTLCNRLDSVLDGLLNLGTAAPPASPGEATRPPTRVQPTRPPRRTSDPEPLPVLREHTGGAGQGLLLATLAFLVGILGGALVLLWLQRQPQHSAPATQIDSAYPGARSANPGSTLGRPAAPSRPPSLPDSAAPVQQPPAREEPEPGGTTGETAVATAIASVERLYAAINAGDSETARRLFSAAAADQFDPTFFQQFSRISVSDLRPTATTGSEVTLEGQVTFFYPDGRSQVESRSFTVDSASEPALIIASAFGEVLRAR